MSGGARLTDHKGPGRGWWSADEAATEAVGEELGASLPDDVTLLLDGEMGSGKTVLVRGLARAWGVDRREIQSPTYTLIHEHQGERGPFVHVDLYRLDPEDLPSLGLEELLGGPGLKAVEWPDRLPAPPPRALRLTIRAADAGRRRIELEEPGAAGGAGD